MPYRGLGNAHEAKLYRALVKELAHYAIFRINTKGRIESWNLGVERVLGYSEPEFLKLSFADLFTVEDRLRGLPEEELRIAAAEGRSSDERWHVRKDGRRFFADGIVTPIADENGRVLGFTKVLRDVTERKIAEQEKDRLAAYLSELAHALDQTHAIIRTFDGKITIWTQGVEFLYGWSSSEARGSRTHELLKTSFPEPLECINERLLQAGEWHGELTHVTKGGKKLTVASHWVLHTRDDSAPASVIEVNNDITEVKKVQAELEEINRKLNGANAELISFAYEVAHDLKEPLRGISSVSQLLSKSFENSSSEAQQDLLDIIVRSSKRLDLLIDGLLEYATLEEASGNVEPVALEDVLADVRSNLNTVIGETGAHVVWEAMPLVIADRVRLLRLLQNLIANSIKFARPGVWPVVRLSAKRQGDEWQIDVADNGRGIQPEFLQEVFMPLKRAHGSDTAGVGLGLAICRRIVESEGGRIWVDSDPSSGSTFHFTVKAVS